MDALDNWLPVDTYNAVRTDKYNGKYSIQQGNRGENDTYTTWCCPQRWVNGEKRLLEKNGEPVFVPWALSLGKDKAKALQIWAAIGEQLKRL